MASITMSPSDICDPNEITILNNEYIKHIFHHSKRQTAVANKDIIINDALMLLKKGNDIVLSCKTIDHWRFVERFLKLLDIRLEKMLKYFENDEIPEIIDAKYVLDANFKELHPLIDFVS